MDISFEASNQETVDDDSSVRFVERLSLSDSEDDNEQSKCNTTGITWRMDPQSSFSDWIIETHSPNGSTATYHVHKRLLTVGRAKCDYFVHLFQKGGDNRRMDMEFSDSTSCFDFDQNAADVFPNFLDFVYGTDHQSDEKNKCITIENAIAMYYLADCLGCEYLRRYIRRFFRLHLTTFTVLTFYIDAKRFRNDIFIDEIARYCAMNIDTLDTDIAEVSDHAFWLDVLSKYQDSSNQSQKLSRFIAFFCAKNIPNLDKELFAQLTNGIKLPQIHHDVAILFMFIEYSLLLDPNHQNDDLRKTNLQVRCEAALVGHWHEINMEICTNLLLVKKTHSALLGRLLKLAHEEIKRLTTNEEDDNNDAS